jgi:hypothetical protein
VHRFAYNGDVVAFKMSAGKASSLCFFRAEQSEDALPAPIFKATLRAAAGSRYVCFAQDLKNSQLTCGGITTICKTVH